MEKGESDSNIINKVLFFNEEINQIHIDLCKDIFNNRVTLDLPVPRSKNVIPFSKVAGIEN